MASSTEVEALFDIEGISDTLIVRRLHGEEAISRLPAFEVEFGATGRASAPEARSPALEPRDGGRRVRRLGSSSDGPARIRMDFGVVGEV